MVIAVLSVSCHTAVLLSSLRSLSVLTHILFLLISYNSVRSVDVLRGDRSHINTLVCHWITDLWSIIQNDGASPIELSIVHLVISLIIVLKVDSLCVLG